MRSRADYPTSVLAHGPMLFLDGHDLAEEGVGFGVPVAMRDSNAVFAGSTTSRHGDGPVAADAVLRAAGLTYRLDLTERLVFGAERHRSSGTQKGGWTAPRLLDKAHGGISRLHRERPGMRPVLDYGSRALRSVARMTTRFDPTEPAGSVTADYEIPEPGVLAVTVDPRGLTDPAVTSLAIMNELGATAFTHYRDASGLELAGGRIESWAEVNADWAALAAPALGLELVARAVPGARMFRGRELSAGRLAWAGFAYLVGPPWQPFSYDMRVRVRGADGYTGAGAGTCAEPGGTPPRLPTWSLR